MTTFTIFNIPVHNVEFIVGGGEPGQGTVGLLGQNILRFADVEYDLAHGIIRFFKPDGCKHVNLAYWLKRGDSYSLMDIQWASPTSPHTIGTAYLNGAKIRVAFDSGAATTIVGLRAAERAGVNPGGSGVIPAGVSSGLGRWRVQTWIATFPSLKIGDEEVHNARLHFGDIGPAADMLVGADFFLSHRIYVASSQTKLYFTYNGGPIFNLTSPHSSAVATPGPLLSPSTRSTAAEASSPPGNSVAPAPASSSSAEAAATAPTIPNPARAEPDAPTDAAGFARRGAARAARRDFEHALEDFTRACALAPTEPSYFYERGRVRLANGQPDLAMSDFDRTIELKPDQGAARLSRAELRMRKHDTSGAVEDLGAADRLSPSQADLRLQLAELYEQLDQFPEAIAQFDLWLAVHAQDARVAQALNGRCRVRALSGQQLDRALSDCNAALRMYPRAARILDSRGLVFLRRGKLKKAIADYDAALNIDPKLAWSLYGRGVAKLRMGMTDAGRSDIAGAVALAPALPERANRFGIVP